MGYGLASRDPGDSGKMKSYAAHLQQLRLEQRGFGRLVLKPDAPKSDHRAKLKPVIPSKQTSAANKYELLRQATSSLPGVTLKPKGKFGTRAAFSRIFPNTGECLSLPTRSGSCLLRQNQTPASIKQLNFIIQSPRAR